MVSAVGHPDLSAQRVSPGPILLNARAATRPTITGVERWTREVLPRLQALDPACYRIVTPARWARRRSLGQSWEQTALPALAAQVRARLVFSPANLAPIAWARNVVVVHDAAVLRTPDAYSRAYRTWHELVGMAAARRAAAVITVSEFSRSELISLAGLDPERIHVVPGGVSERFHPGMEHVRVTTKLGLDRPYVLTVATADRRKNIAALAVAAQRLAAEGIDLVWAGDNRPYFSAAPTTPGVRVLGYIDDADLPGLYAGASAFVLPSSCEGLGLTCLEAMATGVPVVAAGRGALPETCGDAALLVDPERPEELAAALVRIITSDRLRDDLVRSGVTRASELTWQGVAHTIHALLLDVVSDK